MYSLFLRNQHRSKTAETPGGIKDDTSVSLSSWACLDTSDRGSTSRSRCNDTVIRHVHTTINNNLEPRTMAQPSRSDDASISMSISSWAGIDTGHHQENTRLHYSDGAINYFPPSCNSFRASEPKKAITVQASKAARHCRESSWGQMDLEFMANLSEHREKAAQKLIRQRQGENASARRRTGAAKSPGSFLDLPGAKSRDKLHAPRRGRPPLLGRRMRSTRA
jgi:hypothetical protein